MHHRRLPVVQVGQALQDLAPPLLHRLDVQALVALAVLPAGRQAGGQRRGWCVRQELHG